MGTLPAAEPAPRGLTNAAEGGLGENLWAGTSREDAEKLIASLPISASAQQNDVTRRLLLTAAKPPEGPRNGPSFLGQRAQRLLALGDLAGAQALAEGMAPGSGDESMAEVKSDLLLLAKRKTEACKMGEDLNQAAQGTYWLKLVAFCRALSEDEDGSNLAADMAREMGDNDDLFATLLRAIQLKQKPKIDKVQRLTPLLAAMFEAANLPLPREAAQLMPALARAQALDSGADPLVRIAAGERAALAGIFSADELRAVMEEADTGPAELETPLALLKKKPGPLANAAAVKASGRIEDPVARLNLVQAAVNVQPDAGRKHLMARLLAPAIADLGPGAFGPQNAKAAIRLLLMGSAFSEARALAQANGLTGGLGDGPSILMLVAGIGPAGADGDALGDYLDRAKAPPSGAGADRNAVLLILLDALGMGVPASAWDRLGQFPAPDPKATALQQLLRDAEAAADGNQRGLAIGLALRLLGPQGPARATPAALGAAIATLSKMDLMPEARGLALEALFARGF